MTSEMDSLNLLTNIHDANFKVFDEKNHTSSALPLSPLHPGKNVFKHLVRTSNLVAPATICYGKLPCSCSCCQSASVFRLFVKQHSVDFDR